MIILVRHGQTPYNAEHRLQGQLDIPLSEEGRRQADELGKRLKSEGARFDALYSSKLTRAVETARIIGKYLGLEPKPIDGIEEICLGCFQGHTFEEAAVLFPDAYAEHLKHGTKANAHGGETEMTVLDRARRALLALPEAKEGRALVVSHGAVIGYLRAFVAGDSLERVTELIPGNAETIVFGEEELRRLAQ